MSTEEGTAPDTSVAAAVKPPGIATNESIELDELNLPLKDLEGEEEGEKEGGNICAGRTLRTRICQGIAGASVVINIVAMPIEGSAVAIVAGIIAVLVGPVVIWRQFQLQNTDTMRQVQNALRKEVNRLALENRKMSLEVNELEVQVGQLKEQEVRLAKITEEQGSNVNSLVELVKENRKTIDKLKELVEADTVQTLVTAIINSDFDSSSTFSDREMKMLELRLNNIEGVSVNHEALQRSMGKSSRTLDGVLQLVQSMDEAPEGERIFTIDSNLEY